VSIIDDPIVCQDDELDTGYDLSDSEYVPDIRKDALECMSHFFLDKEFWAGGAIAKSKLYKEDHVKVVMEFNIMDSLAIAYYCLERNPPDTVNTKEKGWDVKLCFECLRQCASRWIPKSNAGGMLLVYLSMCHGVEFLPVVKKLKEIRKAFAEKERQEEVEQDAMELASDVSEDELHRLIMEQQADDD
jgi:hypothetical protein